MAMFQYICKGECGGKFSLHVVLDTNTDNPHFNYSKVKCIHDSTPPFVIEHGKDQVIPTELSRRVEEVAPEPCAPVPP